MALESYNSDDALENWINFSGTNVRGKRPELRAFEEMWDALLVLGAIAGLVAGVLILAVLTIGICFNKNFKKEFRVKKIFLFLVVLPALLIICGGNPVNAVDKTIVFTAPFDCITEACEDSFDVAGYIIQYAYVMPEYFEWGNTGNFTIITDVPARPYGQFEYITIPDLPLDTEITISVRPFDASGNVAIHNSNLLHFRIIDTTPPMAITDLRLDE